MPYYDAAGKSSSPRIKLREARSDRRWNQTDLADQIGTTSVTVSRWERGLARPGPYFRRKLCLLFSKSEEELDLRPDDGMSSFSDDLVLPSPAPLLIVLVGYGKSTSILG